MDLRSLKRRRRAIYRSTLSVCGPELGKSIDVEGHASFSVYN
jgi:hypothetical protein